jgi:hypothetical protein
MLGKKKIKGQRVSVREMLALLCQGKQRFVFAKISSSMTHLWLERVRSVRLFHSRCEILSAKKENEFDIIL